MEMDGIRIVPTGEEHLEGFVRCVDAVARERRYMARLAGPTPEQARDALRAVIEGGGVHVVAVDGAGTVVGWCDVERHGWEGLRHRGSLSVGMLPETRGRGLGRRLMTEAIKAARRQGMERIELEVFASNTRAIALYESLGFEREGLKRRARKLDGEYDDDVQMALLMDSAPPS